MVSSVNNTLEGTDCGDAGLPAKPSDVQKPKTILRLVTTTPSQHALTGKNPRPQCDQEKPDQLAQARINPWWFHLSQSVLKKYVGSVRLTATCRANGVDSSQYVTKTRAISLPSSVEPTTRFRSAGGKRKPRW